MKELTAKQKLQAFALYLGSPIVMTGRNEAIGFGATLDYSDFLNEELEDFGEIEYKLLLRPLSEITDEELKAFCFSKIEPDDDCAEVEGASNVKVIWYLNYYLDIKWTISLDKLKCSLLQGDNRLSREDLMFTDYLRQIGIDAPYHGKTMKDWGLAVYQRDIDEKEINQ